jgi:prevent-host-death family protein
MVTAVNRNLAGDARGGDGGGVIVTYTPASCASGANSVVMPNLQVAVAVGTAGTGGTSGQGQGSDQGEDQGENIRRYASGHSGTTLCHKMDVTVRELRNHTARVISAVESGERVVLTVHGRPVADIVPHRERSERRSSERLLAELAEIDELAAALDVASPEEDFDVGLTTDDMIR